MGICPIPTSEGNKKTKMETIVKRYDPVSRRSYDIRIDCVHPYITPINLSAKTPWGPWTLTWSSTDANYSVVTQITGTPLNIGTYTLNSCQITNPDIYLSGSGTIRVQVIDANRNIASSNVIIAKSSITFVDLDGGVFDTDYDITFDAGSYNSTYTHTVDGNYNG